MFSKRAHTTNSLLKATRRPPLPARVVAGAAVAVLGTGIAAALHTGDTAAPTLRLSTATSAGAPAAAVAHLRTARPLTPGTTAADAGAAPVDEVPAAPAGAGATAAPSQTSAEPSPRDAPVPAASPRAAAAGGRARVVALPIAKVSPVSQRCADALVAVQSAGLLLHEGTAFRCPGSTQTFPGDRQHWGVACWQHKHFCATGSYIAANTDEIGPSNHSLRYVVAHEICHIDSYIATGGPGTEEAADLCAAKAGFPR